MGVAVNLRVNNYTNRVLGVIKEKFGLKDKSQALDKLADIAGEEFVEKEVDEKVVAEIIESSNRHVKKYGMRKMTRKQLDELFGL